MEIGTTYSAFSSKLRRITVDFDHCAARKTMMMDPISLTAALAHIATNSIKSSIENIGAQANIEYEPASEYPRARTIANAFERAGWDYQLAAAAPEQPEHPYREGVDVLGADKRLVEGIANALTLADITDVRSTVTENRVHGTNPEFPQVAPTIYVHVGHQGPALDDQRGGLTRLSAWTTPSVLVGIVAILVSYLAAAAPLHWWPF